MTVSVPVETIRGRAVPKLGVGTWELAKDTCREVVRHALRMGVRHVDEARIYGNEEACGQGIAEAGVPREELFITSKLWREDLSRAGVRRQCEESLRALGVPYLDLLLIHWPNPEFVLEETLEEMERLRGEGKIRELGVSNFPPGWLKRALAAAPVFCNQVEYHPFLSQGAIHGMCVEHDVLLTAYSPLARGETAQAGALDEIGRAYGKSGAQVALRWLVEQEQVAAIPRSSQTGHLEEDFDIFDFELSDADRARIDALPKDRRQVNPEFAPDWGA